MLFNNLSSIDIRSHSHVLHNTVPLLLKMQNMYKSTINTSCELFS